jgi:hypothetical protein
VPRDVVELHLSGGLVGVVVEPLVGDLHRHGLRLLGEALAERATAGLETPLTVPINNLIAEVIDLLKFKLLTGTITVSLPQRMRLRPANTIKMVVSHFV